jgi:hypothetical protein
VKNFANADRGKFLWRESRRLLRHEVMPSILRKSSANVDLLKAKNTCVADASVMKESTRRNFCHERTALPILLPESVRRKYGPLLRHIRLAEINFFSATLIDPQSLHCGDIDLASG